MNRIFWRLLYVVMTAGMVIWTQAGYPSDAFAQNNSNNDDTRVGSNDNNEFGVVSTTIQLPTLGVAIDAEGVLRAKVFADPKGELIRKRIEGAKLQIVPKLHNRSKHRKISLRRLEAEIVKRLEAGQKPTDEMRYLAGLVRANYVFVYPKHGDIIIAGPAEPWVANPAGRVVGIHSNLPTLMLEDLLAALRTFKSQKELKKWVAVSIDPTPEGLERLKAFEKSIPKQISPSQRGRAAIEIASGLQESLGNAKIRVHGINRKTHLAQVMIESDYRMKLLAIGLESEPVKMTTFIEALKGAPRNMQRWWLMPHYKCVIEAKDKLAIQLFGQGVMLSTSDIVFDEKARIVHTGKKPSPAATKYANSFTKNYDKISKIRPVFAQLRNGIDLLVLSAWIAKTGAYDKVEWTPNLLLDESKYSINTWADPQETPCLANAVWKEHILVAPSGGGVSITAAEALDSKNLVVDFSGAVKTQSDEIIIPKDESIWWWD